MSEDLEWASWQDDFRAMAEPPSASDLRCHVVRHGRHLRLLFWSEVALAAAMVVLPAWWLAVAPAAWKWAWAGLLWGFGAMALVWSVINRRGTWRSSDDSLAAQLDLTELRCRRQLRTLVFVPLMVLGEIVAVVIFFERFPPRLPSLAYALLAAATLAIAIGWIVGYKRTRRRLSQVAALRRELAEDADPGAES